ncbi:MAG: ATP synthase F1 subunit delta [Holosporales bacterium]|jgi:F-type H+-transporting ATPase subunit delta|nr:ATP synthase F1 subunit delta [Holosporales bacterium]
MSSPVLSVDISSLNVLYASVPGRYARALFNEGKAAGCLHEIFDDFEKLCVFFKEQPSVKKWLTGGCVNVSNLDAGWEIVGGHLALCRIFRAFIRQVVYNRRFNIIGKIRYVFNVAIAKYRGMRNVIVSSTVELSPDQKARIEKLISDAFDERAIIRYKINEKILAGIKIASEEVIVDASAMAKLRQLLAYYRNLRASSTL